MDIGKWKFLIASLGNYYKVALWELYEKMKMFRKNDPKINSFWSSKKQLKKIILKRKMTCVFIRHCKLKRSSWKLCINLHMSTNFCYGENYTANQYPMNDILLISSIQFHPWPKSAVKATKRLPIFQDMSYW